MELDASSFNRDPNSTGTVTIKLVRYDDAVARFEVQMRLEVETIQMNITMIWDVDRRDPASIATTMTGNARGPAFTSHSQGRAVFRRLP